MSINLLLSVKLLAGVSGYNSKAHIKYPQGLGYKSLTTIEVFCTAVRSYSSIHFNYAHILIDTEGLDDSDISIIKEVIYNSIKAEKLFVHFERPNTKRGWISFLQKIDNSVPYLVNMNHDMILKCSGNELTALMVRLNQQLMTTNSVLSYSHIPEMVSWASNNIKGYNFKQKNGRWESEQESFWLDGIFIMSKETLILIFESIKGSGPSYLPRFDWPQVSFARMKLVTIVVPVNLFEHYDGSTHVLCSKLLEKFRIILHYSDSDKCSNLFREFLEVFHISFCYWFVVPRLHSKKLFRIFLINSYKRFIEAKKICGINLSNVELDRLHGLILFYESIIYEDSKSDSNHVFFSLKSYILFIKNKLKWRILK